MVGVEEVSVAVFALGDEAGALVDVAEKNATGGDVSQYAAVRMIQISDAGVAVCFSTRRPSGS
jgi:hypothetical protein